VTRSRHNAYTMVEMLIVTLIVAMLFAVIMPRATKTPKRMAAEQALTEIRRAMLDAASRARATGVPWIVAVHSEDSSSCLELSQAVDANLSRDWRPAMPSAVEEAEQRNKLLANFSTYELPSTLEWTNLDNAIAEYGDDCRYVFYQDGQAGGPDLEFTVGGRRFVLSVDKLGGQPRITEKE